MSLISKIIGIVLLIVFAPWPLINGFLEIELLMAGEWVYQILIGLLGVLLLWKS